MKLKRLNWQYYPAEQDEHGYSWPESWIAYAEGINDFTIEPVEDKFSLNCSGFDWGKYDSIKKAKERAQKYIDSVIIENTLK